MNISVFIGRRLSFRDVTDGHESLGKRRGSSAGVPIAVGGIALAVIIMMISLSVVIGFKQEIRRKVTGFSSELTVFPQSRTLSTADPIDLSDKLSETLSSTLPQAHFDPVVEIPGILKTDSAIQGVMVKAYEASAKGYGFISSYIVDGRMPLPPSASDDSLDGVPPQPEIALAATNALRLGLSAGDKVVMHFVTDGTLRTRRVVISGIYDTHLGEYDSKYVYSIPQMVRSVAKIPKNSATSIEINGIDEDSIMEATSRLSASLLELSAQTPGYNIFGIENVLHTGQAYFSWLDLLDTNVVVILVLMALVSGFTLISSLFILILERVRTIGILKSLGATNGQIRGIFIYMAERLVARGLLLGNAGALAFILLQHYLHLIPLDADAYFLSFVPASLAWGSFVLLNISVIVISALILILPSHLVATLSPSESMRYE